MTRALSRVISYCCLALILLVPASALYLLIDIGAFETLARQNLNLPIQWHRVTLTQWYSLWVMTALYLAIGLSGVYFLRRAFTNFAKGELFNLANSRDLRWFAVLMFAQAVARPVFDAASSVLLSLYHPPGEKILSISFGSHELGAIALALVFWVMSNLLVEGCKLQTENRQFV